MFLNIIRENMATCTRGISEKILLIKGTSKIIEYSDFFVWGVIHALGMGNSSKM
jgi:hypothetical protein